MLQWAIGSGHRRGERRCPMTTAQYQPAVRSAAVVWQSWLSRALAAFTASGSCSTVVTFRGFSSDAGGVN